MVPVEDSMAAAATRPAFAETLVVEGLIDADRLDEIRESAARQGVRLSVAVVREGGVDEADLVRALSRVHGCPAVDLSAKAIDLDTLALVPPELCWKHPCLPLFVSRGGARDVLYLGLDDPGDLEVIDDVGFRTGLRIRPVVVGPVQLEDALRRHAGEPGPPDAIASFSEAPLLQTDTAPLIAATPAELLELDPMPEAAPAAPATVTLPSAPEPEAVTLPSASEPEAVTVPSTSEPTRESTEPLPEPADMTEREVRTRRILQALTRVLIAKELLTREELVAEVRTLEAEGD
jgi:hypothetical protein